MGDCMPSYDTDAVIESEAVIIRMPHAVERHLELVRATPGVSAARLMAGYGLVAEVAEDYRVSEVRANLIERLGLLPFE
jgi:hypothetical protein